MPLSGPAAAGTSGAVTGVAAGSGDGSAGVKVVGGSVPETVGKALAALGAAAVGAGASRWASAGRRGEAVTGAAGRAGAGAPVATPCVGAGRGSAAGGVSALRVTVPCSEKLRSWEGPTVSAELVAGAGIAMFVAGASASWASAGAAKPAATNATAGIMRKPGFILTRSNWLEPRPTAATPAL